MKLGTLFAPFAILVVAPAFADDKPAEKCPFTDELRGWQDVDENTIVIDVMASRYRVTFINPCRESQDATAAKFVSRPGICLTAGDRMVFRSHTGSQGICLIKSVEKIEPAPAH